MADYILRDVDDDVWRRFKVVCAQKSTSIRDEILSLIRSDIILNEGRKNKIRETTLRAMDKQSGGKK